MRRVSVAVLKNSTFNLVGQALVKALSLLFSVLVVRRLGDASYGEYSTALAYVGVFAILSDVGLAPYMVREIARERRRVDQLFSNVVVLRLLLSAFTVLIIVCSALVLRRSPVLVLGIGIASLSLFIYALEGPIESLLIARERLDYLSYMNVSTQLAFVTLGAVALLSGCGFIGLLVASLLGLLITTAIGYFAFVRRLGGVHWRLRAVEWPLLLKAALPFGLIGFSLGLSYKVDTVLLQYFFGDAATGWYNAAYNVIFMLTTLSHSLNLAIYPSLCRQHAAEPQRVASLYGQALKYLFLSSLPLAVGIAVLGDKFVRFIYTPQFDPSILPLRILIWVLPLMFLTEMFGNVALVYDQERKVVRALLISTAFNVALNLLVIPRYGVVGASVVTVLTELVLLGQYTWILRTDLKTVDRVNTFLKPGLAAVVMGIVLLATRAVGVLVNVAVGAVVYAGMLVGMGVLGRQEIDFVRDLVRSKVTTTEV